MVLFFKFFNNVIDENNLANSTCLDFIEIVIKGCDIGLNNNNNNNNNNSKDQIISYWQNIFIKIW